MLIGSVEVGSAEVGCWESNGGGGCVLMSRFIYDTEPLTLQYLFSSLHII